MGKNRKKGYMYFSSLEIENIKCFEECQKIDLKKLDGKLAPWTLILGENGVGKTTLLKCLSWMVPVQAPDDDNNTNKRKGKTEDVEKVFLKPFMDDFENEQVYDQLVRQGKSTNSRITASFASGIELGSIPEIEDIVTIGMNFKRKNFKLDVIDATKQQVAEFKTPTIFAYNASRHMAFKNIENSDMKDPLSNLFSSSGELYDAEQVLGNLDTAAVRHGSDSVVIDLLVRLKQVLVDLLPDIKTANSIIVNPPINRDGTINTTIVEIQTDDGRIKLKDLSLGYQTMFAWVVDLALRMLWAYPDNKEPLSAPAIVIVDEIDLHLHPIWQRDIRERLTHHFPNTQFICTAHSPFMAQASEDENLCVIKRFGQKIEIENEPLIVKGWRIGQIATSELFGLVTDRGPEEERLIEERRALLEKQKLNNEEKLRLAQLDGLILNLPMANPEEDKIFKLVNEAAELLRSKGILNDTDS